MHLSGIMSKILGFIVIIITLALGPTIYTTNAELNASNANLTNLIGMSVIVGFGAFIIIFGLLISGGIMAIMGKGASGASVGDMLKVIGSVVLIVVMLTLMDSVITYCNTLILASLAADDTLGKVGFGIIPIVIYIGILTVAGWAQVSTIRKMRSGRRARLSSRAYL